MFVFLSVFSPYPFCVSACNTPPANNETDQASEESSENLESTTVEEGEVDDASSGDQQAVLTDGVKTDDKDNSEFREDLPKEKDDEILKAGQEIPNPPDDLEDGTEDSSENMPTPESPREEL